MNLHTENDRLRWLVEEQRLQIRDLEMDITLGLDRQDTASFPPTVTTKQVRAYADRTGTSERTVWRQLKTGKLAVGDIVGEVS